MQSATLLVTLAAVIMSAISNQLSFRLENSEFSIIISASTELINNAIAHVANLQTIIDKTKSIKAMKGISRTFEKAKNVREKFHNITQGAYSMTYMICQE